MKINLFDRWDLDPASGPQAITERFREIAEAASPREQSELRKAWEELTLHPRRRILEALGSHPETRRPLGRPPLPPKAPAHAAHSDADLIAHASVAAPLGATAAPPVFPPIDADPLLFARDPRP